MILISAHQLSKSFAVQTLFEKVSFGIEDKERVGLVGPNGAGKSTLLRILAGQSDSDTGTVSRKRGLRLGFMEQSPTFTPGSTILSALLEKSQHPEEQTRHAIELMSQLQLTDFGTEHLVEKLSGGWKKRVALARELLGEPELLMLDEPTNHLDVSAILWLEDFLRTAPFSVLMITHDRLFLQRVANRILDLDRRNPNYLLSAKGGYAEYLETKEAEIAALQNLEKVQKNKWRRELEWLRRGPQARLTKQQARIQNAHELKDDLKDLQSKNHRRSVDLTFSEAEHSPKKLIEATGLRKAYGENLLFEDLDLLITPKTRVALLGDNGTGKSTLIKVLLDMEKPDTGQIKKAQDLRIAYFEQGRDTLDPNKSVLRNICSDGDHVICQGKPIHVRGYLDRFLFPGLKADLPVSKLSGGEQARLRLAQLMLNSCQVLVLDEPTNDLDSDTLDVLENSLKDFNGAVIIVTHDRYFMDAVADEILAFPPPGAPDRRLTRFASYYQWETWYREELAKLRPREAPKSSAAAAGAASAKRTAKLSFKDKFELENMEATILKLETDIEEMTHLSQDPAVAADHTKLSSTLSRLAETQEELNRKYERWAELEEKIRNP